MAQQHLSTGQIRQLIEIDNAGHGIGNEVQEFIRRLTSGGVADQSGGLRRIQVKRFWDRGVGRELGYRDFEAYLASIPDIPPALLKVDKDFPWIVLVEPRLGLRKLCDRAGVVFSGSDATCAAFDARYVEFANPTWIRVRDGRQNRGRLVSECRESFQEDELGLTALQGVCAYLQHAFVEIIYEMGRNGVDLAGSVCSDKRDFTAILLLDCDVTATLDADHAFFRNCPGCGTASRRVL
ncbi:MAG: hypothetical protein WCT10_04060 [Patescibacteria group bacterium]|jgi:hypothetical protein